MRGGSRNGEVGSIRSRRFAAGTKRKSRGFCSTISRPVATRVEARAHNGPLSGDEFVILLNGALSDGKLEVLRERLEASLTGEIELEDCTVVTGVFVGICNANRTNLTVDEFLSRADQAMYARKSELKSQPV